MEQQKILVVDDESRMRKLVKDFLAKSGYAVIEAGDGSEALDLFFQQKDIALILLDVMMPKMDGWQVCREIRAYSQVPIIMLTAKSDERDELAGFELGVDEYISKPFSPKILVARVEAILRRTGQSGQKSFRFQNQVWPRRFSTVGNGPHIDHQPAGVHQILILSDSRPGKPVLCHALPAEGAFRRGQAVQIIAGRQSRLLRGL